MRDLQFFCAAMKWITVWILQGAAIRFRKIARISAGCPPDLSPFPYRSPGEFEGRKRIRSLLVGTPSRTVTQFPSRNTSYLSNAQGKPPIGAMARNFGPWRIGGIPFPPQRETHNNRILHFLAPGYIRFYLSKARPLPARGISRALTTPRRGVVAARDDSRAARAVRFPHGSPAWLTSLYV